MHYFIKLIYNYGFVQYNFFPYFNSFQKYN